MDGIRTVKTNGSTIHHYTLNGSQIVTETWTTKSSSGAETPNHFLVYLYDENGAPVGLQYRNKTYGTYTFDTYYFEKNLQGDIIAIYTENGTKIGSYTYDAWGNCTVSTESGTTTIQKQIVRTLNPFRYRGYYYDTDTGLYYLQSRYYNPQWGRFLNADVLINTGTGLLGYNIYTYCDNNPVMKTDPNGTFPQWIKNTVKWTTENLAKPVVKTAQKVLSKVDATYSRGINVSGTPSAFIFNLQAGISIDTKGNVAIQGSFGGGFTIGSPSASITSYQSITNAPSIYKLNGSGYQIGGSVGIPVSGVPLAAGSDFNIIPDEALNKIYFGSTTSIGFGTPGRELHVEWGETAAWNCTRFNIFDLAENIYDKIMGW